MTIIDQNLTNLTQPQHYRLPVPQESRPALRAVGVTDEEMDQTDQVACLRAMERVYGAAELYRWCVKTAWPYQWRAGNKGDAAADYAKAQWFLEYAINDLMHAPIPMAEHQKTLEMLEAIPE